jgi:hypothetical protein
VHNGTRQARRPRRGELTQLNVQRTNEHAAAESNCADEKTLTKPRIPLGKLRVLQIDLTGAVRSSHVLANEKPMRILNRTRSRLNRGVSRLPFGCVLEELSSSLTVVWRRGFYRESRVKT